MANLRFSPGLLSSIRDFGSSLTEAPASRANTLTGAGVQPASLGGMMARNVGNLMGKDMRTPQEKLQEVMSQGMETPAQELKVLAEYAKLDPVRGIPLFQAAQKRIRGEKKTQLEQDEQRSAVATAVATKYKDREDVAELVSLAGGGLSFSDIEKVAEDDAELAPKDRYVPVGKRVFDRDTGSFIKDDSGADAEVEKVEYTNDEGEEVIEFVDKKDPTKVLRQIVSPADTGLSATTARIQSNILIKASDAEKKATAADRLLTAIANAEKNQKIRGGIYSTIEEGIKDLTGRQDAISELRMEGRRLITSAAVANLPRGPASDRDVKLVLQGELPMNAGPEALASYARGIKKIYQASARQARDEAAWIDRYGDQRGYNSQLLVNRSKQELVALTSPESEVPKEALAIMAKNMDNPTIRQQFIDEYDIDYVDVVETLRTSQETLSKLNRGF